MNDLWNRRLLFAPDDPPGGGGEGDPPPGGNESGDGEKPTFESWLAGQDEATKELLKDHVKGLKSALDSERDARSDAEKVVRDLADKAEKGSQAQAELTKVADSLAEETRRAEFYELAHDEGIVNLKLAYIVAVQDGLFDKRGNVDFAKMKESYPELFSKSPRKPPGGAGDGVGAELGQPADMNAFIRRSAGRQK